MDAFYASVEQRDRPELRGRPVVVGADPRGRGVVSAASYEARRFGIHSAMPIGRAYRLCPTAAFLPVDMDKYARDSERIMAILVGLHAAGRAPVPGRGLPGRQRLPAPLHGNGVEIARRIKARIRAEVGLTASAGVAPNKFVAKIASDLEKPDGLVVVGAGSGGGVPARSAAPPTLGRRAGGGARAGRSRGPHDRGSRPPGTRAARGPSRRRLGRAPLRAGPGDRRPPGDAVARSEVHRRGGDVSPRHAGRRPDARDAPRPGGPGGGRAPRGRPPRPDRHAQAPVLGLPHDHPARHRGGAHRRRGRDLPASVGRVLQGSSPPGDPADRPVRVRASPRRRARSSFRCSAGRIAPSGSAE